MARGQRQARRDVVGRGEMQWDMVGCSGTWWDAVGRGEMQWDVVGCGGTW